MTHDAQHDAGEGLGGIGPGGTGGATAGTPEALVSVVWSSGEAAELLGATLCASGLFAAGAGTGCTTERRARTGARRPSPGWSMGCPRGWGGKGLVGVPGCGVHGPAGRGRGGVPHPGGLRRSTAGGGAFSSPASTRLRTRFTTAGSALFPVCFIILPTK